MELDELKQAWQQLDQRLDRQYALEMHRFDADRIERARRRLRPLWFGQLLQIAFAVVTIVLSASFWSAHRDSAHLMAWGLTLHVYGLLMVLSAARNLYLIGRVDYGEPVLTIQKRLASLRAWRVRVEAPVFGILGCFVWIPFVLALFKAQLGVDLWNYAPEVVWWFIASGVVCLFIVLGVIAMARRPGLPAFTAAVSRHAAGGSVWRAQAEVADIARFEES